MRKSILASTAAVATATVLVRLFGFLREIVLAASYGAGTHSDAFVIAFTVPSTVLALVGTSTAAVFIPTHSRIGSGKDKFTGNVLTILALIGLVFSLVFTFVPQALTYLFASQLDAETFALASRLMRIMIWSAVPMLFGGILQAYLQIQNAFFIGTVLNIPINIAAIASIQFSKPMDMPMLMGFGVVAGNVATLALLLFAAARKGYVYRPSLDFRAPELREMAVLLAPVMLSTFIGDINQIIDRNFASSLASGGVSALNYAARVISVMISLIGMSVATALFPRLSELAAGDDVETIRRHIISCIKKIVPILLPATLGIILLANPIVRVMFERGDFVPAHTQRTAECLRMYAALLFASSLNAVVIKALFSMRNTKAPAVISATGVVINAGLNFLLIGPLQHQGLALATSAAAGYSTVMLLLVLRKHIGTLRFRADAREWMKTLLAALVMGVIVFFGSRLLPVMSGGALQCAAYTASLVLAGAASYIVMHALLRTEFLKESVGLLRGLLKR